MNNSSIPQRIKAFNDQWNKANSIIKYACMAQDPFRFFRGTCHLFYEDLLLHEPLEKSPLAWLCGDLHIENMGSFKANNRLVYFDLNDFDESILGFAHWDVLRMLTSIYVGLTHLKIKEKKSHEWVRLFLDTYFETLQEGKAIYIEPRTAKGLVRKFLIRIAERKQKATIQKNTFVTGGKRMLLIDKAKHFPLPKPKKKQLMSELQHWINDHYKPLKGYKVIDACERIAGTGSIGVQRYLFLLLNTDAKKQHLLLDMKEARSSSVAQFSSLPNPVWASQAERVVSIQKRMQNFSPALLSSISYEKTSFVIKEMQPTEDKVNFDSIRKQPELILEVMLTMAVLTASAQIRSSGRQGSSNADELIEYGHTKKGFADLTAYAFSYSQKVNRDYKEFLIAYQKGFFESK